MVAADVVVDDVVEHVQPAPVRLVDEPLQRLVAVHPAAGLVLEPVAALDRERVRAHVAPVARALDLVRREHLDRVDPELLQVVELLRQVLERGAVRVPALAEEAARVELVDHPLAAIALARDVVELEVERGIGDHRAAEADAALRGDEVAPAVVVVRGLLLRGRELAVAVLVVDELQLAVRVGRVRLQLVAQADERLGVVDQGGERAVDRGEADLPVGGDVLAPEVVERAAAGGGDELRIDRPEPRLQLGGGEPGAVRVLEHEVRLGRGRLVVDLEPHQLGAAGGVEVALLAGLRVEVEAPEPALLAHHHPRVRVGAVELPVRRVGELVDVALAEQLLPAGLRLDLPGAVGVALHRQPLDLAVLVGDLDLHLLRVRSPEGEGDPVLTPAVRAHLVEGGRGVARFLRLRTEGEGEVLLAEDRPLVVPGRSVRGHAPLDLRGRPVVDELDLGDPAAVAERPHRDALGPVGRRAALRVEAALELEVREHRVRTGVVDEAHRALHRGGERRDLRRWSRR